MTGATVDGIPQAQLREAYDRGVYNADLDSMVAALMVDRAAIRERAIGYGYAHERLIATFADGYEVEAAKLREPAK